MLIKAVIFLISFFFCWPGITVGAESERLLIGNFTNGELSGWEPLEFYGRTEYSVIEKDKGSLLQAKSKASASGLVKKVRVDLHEYPFLNWSWQVVEPLGKFAEQRKSGDDFAARIYVITADGIFPWNKKTVNYVWAGTTLKGQVWASPYAGKKSMMVAVRSGEDVGADLYTERRNLYADFKKLFGKEIRYIDAVALMTDSDDSKGEAIANYGDIYFSKK